MRMRTVKCKKAKDKKLKYIKEKSSCRSDSYRMKRSGMERSVIDLASLNTSLFSTLHPIAIGSARNDGIAKVIS